MDITNAGTEPFYLYHKSLQSLNNNVKSTSGAIDIALCLFDDNNSHITHTFTNEQIVVQPWSWTWPNDKTQTLESARISLARLNVVQAFSSFERFLEFTHAELCRWSDFIGKPQPSASQREKCGNISLSLLCDSHGWKLKLPKSISTLFTLAQELRNCIVHRDGRANKGLEDFLQSAEWLGALEAWPFSKGQILMPDLPGIRVNEFIPLQPKHAILVAGILHFIASRIDSFAVVDLGVSGIVHMAAYHSLFSDFHEYRGQHYVTPYTAIVHFLYDRYRLFDATPELVLPIIRELDLTQAVHRRHEELFSRRSI